MFKSLWAKPPARQSTKSAQQTEVDIDGCTIQWRRSSRRTRSLSLKVDKNGQVIVMTPMRSALGEVRHFVHSRQQWIVQQLERHQARQSEKENTLGEMIWWKGEPLTIHFTVGSKNMISAMPNCLEVESRQPLSKENIDQRVKKWLRAQAEIILPERVTEISMRANLHAKGLKIKAYTARWGSCRHDGLIQLNWKLIMTPPAVTDYVITHELCHLKHFNHSPQFWARVELSCPDYRVHRLWLKNNGRPLIET